jgi:hypothetical protein
VTHIMKTDEALDRMNIDRFGARAVAVQAHGGPNSIKQFRLFRGGRGGVRQFVAFG